MAKLNEKQLTFEGVMRIVQGNKWIQLKDIERLEKFIQNQQATIQSLKEENEQLKKEYKIAIDEMVTDYKKLEKENEQLRKENEEYEKESGDMQTKINVLYNEAKKHMSGTEWKKFNRRIIEREEELGIKWVRL